MTEAQLRFLAQRSRMQYEYVDRELRVRGTNPPFWRLIGLPVPDLSVPLGDVFPEFIGLEEETAMILSEGIGEVAIPLVNRFLTGGDPEGIYVDVTLLAHPNFAPGLVLLIEDITAQSLHQRRLLQSRNENKLLQDKLRRRSRRLRATAERLAEAERVLRDRNEELERLNEKIRDHTHSLEHAVRLRTEALRRTRLEVIHRLALAAEIRDPQARGHIARMSRYSAMIAARIGMTEADREMVYQASLLHDMGKIAIPDRILQKPGPLLPEEMEIMRKHSGYGAELLGGSGWDFMRAASTIARTHHERWDGTGYPDGLSGTGIPLVGRICAVADVFDALTMERAYKKAWSVDDAAAEIGRQSGRAFDPDVARAFLSILPDIQRVHAQGHGGETDLEYLEDEEAAPDPARPAP